MVSREEQIAWAAGLFEGEGCCLMDHPNTPTKQKRAKVRLIMYDEDIVRRFYTVVGMGTFRGPIDHGRTTKHLVYKVEIARWNDLMRLYELFKPYLGERRTAWFEEAIATCKPKFTQRVHDDLPQDCGYCEPGEVTTKGYTYHRKMGTELCQGCHAAQLRYHRQYREKKGRK